MIPISAISIPVSSRSHKGLYTGSLMNREDSVVVGARIQPIYSDSHNCSLSTGRISSIQTNPSLVPVARVTPLQPPKSLCSIDMVTATRSTQEDTRDAALLLTSIRSVPITKELDVNVPTSADPPFVPTLPNINTKRYDHDINSNIQDEYLVSVNHPSKALSLAPRYARQNVLQEHNWERSLKTPSPPTIAPTIAPTTAITSTTCPGEEPSRARAVSLSLDSSLTGTPVKHPPFLDNFSSTCTTTASANNRTLDKSSTRRDCETLFTIPTVISPPSSPTHPSSFDSVQGEGTSFHTRYSPTSTPSPDPTEQSSSSIPSSTSSSTTRVGQTRSSSRNQAKAHKGRSRTAVRTVTTTGTYDPPSTTTTGTSSAKLPTNRPVQKILRKKFSWKNYPELEAFLIANREEYLRHSALNYTMQQKTYNNRLTDRLLDLASECGYVFDKETFSFVTVRDRIRCYFKSYVQSKKKRGVIIGYAARKAGLLTEEDLEKSAGKQAEIVVPKMDQIKRKT